MNEKNIVEFLNMRTGLAEKQCMCVVATANNLSSSEQQSENTHDIEAWLYRVLLGGCYIDLGHQAISV